MSTANNGMDQQYGRDTMLGFRQYHELVNPRTGAAPVLADVDRLVTAVLPVTGSTQTFTLIAQPDVPRNVTMTLTDAGSGVQEISAMVRGRDWWGNAMNERLTLNLSGTASYLGLLPFWIVDAITAVTSPTIAGGVTVSFGVGSKLGIPVRLKDATDIIAKREDANEDTTGVIVVNAGGISTWLPATVPDATNRYFMTIASRYGVIS